MFEINYFFFCFDRIRFSWAGPFFGVDKSDYFSSRFYQNWLQFFARSFFLAIYFGGKSFILEKPINSSFLILVSLYLGFQMRNARFFRGKAIKREMKGEIKSGLKKAEHYHFFTQLIGSISVLLMFFSGVVMKDDPSFSFILFIVHFIFSFLTSEALYLREKSIYLNN